MESESHDPFMIQGNLGFSVTAARQAEDWPSEVTAAFQVRDDAGDLGEGSGQGHIWKGDLAQWAEVRERKPRPGWCPGSS